MLTFDDAFARLVVKHGLATAAQVEDCLGALRRGGRRRTLADVLVERGHLTLKQRASLEHHLARHPELTNPGPAPTRAPERAQAESGAAAAGAPPARTVAEVERLELGRLSGQDLDAYLVEARTLGASDLHFQVGAPPFLRLHGELVPLRHPPLERADAERAILAILDERQRAHLEAHHDLDLCHAAAHGRYRGSILHERKGVDAIFRIVPDRISSLAELHLPPVLEELASFRHGLVLITGAAGSGKTATLAALLEHLNESRDDHIITVEDPIEQVIASRRCNVDQRQVEVHTRSFAQALRSALRADPDYLAVGELRDLDTISMALTAAETGHLVFATLHTRSATRAIDRLIEAYAPREQAQVRAMISESLVGVVAQQLLPRADGRGREPATEVLVATTAVRNLIRERKTFQLGSILQTNAARGMTTMDDSIAGLVERGLVSAATARRFAAEPDRFP